MRKNHSPSNAGKVPEDKERDYHASRNPHKNVTAMDDVLKSMFKLGDHLEVFFRDQVLGGGGTYITAFHNVLVWVDRRGHINVTNVSGPVSVRKIKRDRKKRGISKKQADPCSMRKDKGNHTCEKKDTERRDEELLNFVKIEQEQSEAGLSSDTYKNEYT
ncbi:hypothetical protein [Halobacillus sp. Cin3]|uniref:hypothetical protein n=1 Tax=Halobacillus sp. Cin3 TaxID=2928441 RepID=UPI00248D824F|nr:hypothetical protein [Halobacillus sp. Cin3]